MIATTTTETIPFTPKWLEKEADAPVFQLRAGGVIERAQLEAELAGPYRSAKVYGFELTEALRSGVRALLHDDPELDHLLGLIEAEAAVGAAEDGDGAEPLSEADKRILAEVRNVMAQNWPDYRDLVAQLERRREIAPVVAFRRFCTGWSGISTPFARGRDGLVTEAALKGVGHLEMLSAGNRAYSLLYPDTSAEKNSSPPGSSGSDPKTSGSGDVSKEDGTSPGSAG